MKPVNKRKQTEEEYRTIIRAAMDGFWITDMQGRFLEVNDACCRLTGYSRDELLSMSVPDVEAVERPEETVAHIKKVMENGSDRFETRHRRKDGKVVDIEVSVNYLQTAGGRFFVFLRDTTERKQMQAQLAQADRMASVGVLAAGVAHEINNPLTFVLYNLESLAQDLPKLTAALANCWSVLVAQLGPEQAAKALGDARDLVEKGQIEDVIERAGEAAVGARRIRNIVRDLKTFARSDEERRVPVSVNRVLESAINMAYNEIRFRARLVKEPGQVPEIMASEGRLAQVFLNLLVNAAQAIEEGQVERNEIRVRTFTAGEEVLVEVRDTGPGIPPENLPRIFEPFFTTKPRGVGSGLGLPICQGIVAAHGGRIEVESGPGRGSRFVVHLPVGKVEAALPVEEPGAEAPPVRGRILVVDDEPLMGSTLRRVLGREHQVVTVSSGEEGRRTLDRDQGFDLVLCDLMMPDLSGMELHDWIKQSHPDLTGKMVFMTGGAFTPRAQEFLRSIPNLHIEKPFDPKNLMNLIRSLLRAPGRRRPGQP